jgi:hypothetical protein
MVASGDMRFRAMEGTGSSVVLDDPSKKQQSGMKNYWEGSKIEMVSLVIFGGVDIRRAGDQACPAGLSAIKSQPRAAVLQKGMNRVRAWSEGKRLPHHINSFLEDHSLCRGGLGLPFQGRLSEASNVNLDGLFASPSILSQQAIALFSMEALIHPDHLVLFIQAEAHQFVDQPD